MLVDIRQNKKIAGLCAEASAVAFFRDSDPRTSTNARRNAYLDLFGFWRHAFAVTQAARLAATSSTLAIRAALRKLQTPARAHYLSGAFTCRALNNRSTSIARTLA